MHMTKKLLISLKGFSKKRKFLDSLRLYVKGGAGGMGFPKCGGIGGSGGDVYVVGKEDLSLKDVVKKFPCKRIVASNGENAHQRQIIGDRGKDVIVEAPLGVVVYNPAGNKLGELNKEGDKFKVVSGGLGGRLDTGYSGFKGECQVVTLDLKLIADVGLIGFPNAGKSTILSLLSNARPKIASYPFTTVQPQVGMIMYDDHRSVSVADLPGLIEGAHVNIGMGHKFLKHIERTKLLLVVVDVQGFRLNLKYPHRTCLETIILLNKELELYKQEVLNYPTMLIVNKMDTEGSCSIYEEICDAVNNLEGVLQGVSEAIRPVQPFNFQKIIGISAKTGDAKELNKVKQCIREILDQNEGEDIVQTELALYKSFNRLSRESGTKIV